MNSSHPRRSPALSSRRRRLARRAAAVVTTAALVLVTALAHAGHTSLDGRIEVRNDRNAPVTVTIDGDHAGVVRARSKKVFTNVKNGVRLVGYTSSAAPVRNQQLAVPVAGKVKLRIAPVLGSARIRNDSGVTMKVRLDGHKIGRLKPGATIASMALPAGTYELTARPARRHLRAQGHKASAPVVSQQITIRAGEITDARLRPWLARLEVRNPSRQQLAVYMDGVRVAQIPGHGAVVLSKQLPGHYDVSLRGRGAILAKARIDLSPGAAEMWAPEVARRGRMRVTNHTRNTYTLRVDGQTTVVVPAGETRVVADLRPGHHALEATPRRGPALNASFQVVADQVSEVTLAQPLPAHRVHRPVPVQLRVTL